MGNTDMAKFKKSPDAKNNPRKNSSNHKKKNISNGTRAESEFRRDRNDGPKGPPWLYGRHAVIAALANPQRHCHRLVATDDFIQSHRAEVNKAIEESGRKRPDLELMDRRDIDELIAGAGQNIVHQGVILQADPLARVIFEDLLFSLDTLEAPFLVALDQATDPQNIGAVLRSAAAFSASAVLIPERNAPEITASLAKAACGAVERIPLVKITNLSRCLDQLKEEGFWSVGLDGYAEQQLSEIDLKGKTVLVMGNEGSGLRRLTREKCDFLAKIPISNAVESLNLSNATAISLYEIARQR